MGLIEDIGQGPVALDSSVFIYFIEEHPRYLPIVDPLFHALEVGLLQATTSTLTLLETLVQPVRTGNWRLADRYEEILTDSRGLELIPIDLKLLRAAVHVRAATKVKTPDALQIAAAQSAGCRIFVANDGRLPPIPGLRVLYLEAYSVVT
ncbi:MAG TPA: PIN domain-containing protein [Thermoanaerobaculia bacterium]|nr:PIN domain-containing protein [Thermoanaerobaculia bacterium]